MLPLARERPGKCLTEKNRKEDFGMRQERESRKAPPGKKRPASPGPLGIEKKRCPWAKPKEGRNGNCSDVRRNRELTRAVRNNSSKEIRMHLKKLGDAKSYIAHRGKRPCYRLADGVVQLPGRGSIP